jgi:hypothetical protein
MVRTNQAQPVNLPPAAWLASFAQSKRLVDQFELQRATWLWDRRPRFVLVEEQNDESKDNNPPPKNLRAVAAFDVAGLHIAAGLAFFGATLLTWTSGASLSSSPVTFLWRIRWRRDYQACLRRLLK